MVGREKEVVTLVDFLVDADSVGGGKKNEGHHVRDQRSSSYFGSVAPPGLPRATVMIVQ